MARYILLRETASTNTYLKRMAHLLPGGMVVYTHRQTAGRGQKGNSWEAEPGKNITFSLLVKRPAVAPAAQFAISEAVCMAIVDCWRDLVPDLAVKWPNDIYCGDRKLGGILIEHTLEGGAIAHTVIGVGLNVNQSDFVSDAPNPVSLCQITGKCYNIDAQLHAIADRIEFLCDFANPQHEGFERLHDRYMQTLYRNDGKPHPFVLPDGGTFFAIIHAVNPTGELLLEHDDGTIHSYLFKEVKHKISTFTL